MTHCPACGCANTAPVHAILAALRDDDLDAAMALGLLDAPPCPTCSPACSAQLLEARTARQFALASRERYRKRNLRLVRIKAEREAARRPAAAAVATATAAPTQPTVALPTAAADALARALAKAKARHA